MLVKMTTTIAAPTTTDTTTITSSITNRGEIAYFNNAGKTEIPPSVKQAGFQCIEYESQPWNVPSPDDTANDVRKQFSAIIHANPTGEDIAIVPSTSFALTMAAHNLYRTGLIQKNNRILILQDEMSSEVYCWQEVCRLSGAYLDIVPHPLQDGGWTEAIIDKLASDSNDGSNKIAVVCLPQAHWSDGSYVDLITIGKLCRQHSIAFIVDATQSAGIHPNLHMDDICCDVLAASVHKWLLGPHGTSLMYIHPRYHDVWLPLDQHERSRVAFQDDLYDAGINALQYDGVNNDAAISGRERGYPEQFIKGAARCDSGGKKNPILLPMILEGLKHVNTLDVPDCQKNLKSMTDQILDRTSRLGLTVQPGPRVGHILGLRPNDSIKQLLTPATMLKIVENLKRQHIFLAVRCGAFRIAPYLNTTQDEIDRLVKGLEKEILNLLDGDWVMI